MLKKNQIIVILVIFSLFLSSNPTSISEIKNQPSELKNVSKGAILLSTSDIKHIQQFDQNLVQNISTKNYSGPLPNSLNISDSRVDVPMLFSSMNTYDIKLNSTNKMKVSQPANLSLKIEKKPIFYGINFNKFNSSLSVENSTLTSPNAVGVSQYFYNQRDNAFNFTSSGYGGSILSSFNITSFNNLNLYNPFSTPLIFNSSFNFRNIIFPSNGLNYTFYINFLFNPNTSVISSSFPSIIRLNLLYTSNYADNTLFDISNNSNFWFYLNSNSNINVLLRNPSFNGSTSVSLNLSDLLTQIKQNLNITSISDYYNSFEGVEIGFFSYNSTGFRSVNLNINKFVLYNILDPSIYLHLTGLASSKFKNVTISNSLFDKSVTIENCTNLNLRLGFNANYSENNNLFFNHYPLNVMINISYLVVKPFEVGITESNLLNWSLDTLNFPLYSFNNSNSNPKTLFMKKNIFWFIDKSWLPGSLPTTENSQLLLNGTNLLVKSSQQFQQKIWFGGVLANNFSQKNFSVYFYSKNEFSPFHIQGFIQDEELNLTFINNQDINLAKYIILYLNKSSVLIPFLRIYVNNNQDYFSLNLPIFNQNYESKEFSLFILSDSIKSGFFLQSFFVSNILKNYTGKISCSYQTDNSSIITTQSFNFLLKCNFNDSFYSQSFLKKLIISVKQDNISSEFPFDQINFTSNYMLFQRQIFIFNEKNSINHTFIVTYSLFNILSPVPTILWSNSSLFIIGKTTQMINDQINIYSNWPFYGFFSLLILILIQIRRRKTQSILKNQIG